MTANHNAPRAQDMILAIGICVVAALAMMVLMALPHEAVPEWLASRMTAIHSVLELMAIMVSGLVVVSAWHSFDSGRGSRAQVIVIGFIVVAVCDIMHVMTYPGMPVFLTESSAPRTIYFWLMGRTAELLTLAAIAYSLVIRWSRWASLVCASAVSLGLVFVGSYALELFPDTFVPGKGVTQFKSGYEYALSASHVFLGVVLFRRAATTGSKEIRLLGLASILIAIGGVAFMQYANPVELQSIVGHLYKVAAYSLIYVAIFTTSIRAPFEALRVSEKLVRSNEERWRTLGANLIYTVLFQLVRGSDGRIRYSEVSDSIERICGIKASDLLANPKLWGELVVDEDRPMLRAALKRSRETLVNYDIVVRMRRPDGQLRHMHFIAAPRRVDESTIVWEGVATDITQRIEAEESQKVLQAQLSHAQKMESIGTLASGIAHDFNNVLAAILGNANMAIEDVKRGDQGEALVSLGQIRKAGSRARALVNQILSFSRRDAVARTVQPIRPIIEESITLLRSTFPGTVTLEEHLDDQNACALVDRTQIEQVIINLCTNSWHALGDKGGRIAVSTRLVSVDASAAPKGSLLPGRYVQIRVEDNGCGMSEATRQRVFEPFFTTKAPGVGTGLGLSVVHGIVSFHEGAITLESSLGGGTRFDIFLPAADAQDNSGTASVHEGMSSVMGNGERVLYVDDDPVMGLMIERLLRRARFDVRVVKDPEVAARMIEADTEAFDILVTDFNMTAMTGLDLIEVARRFRPDLPVILISGYVSDDLREMCLSLGVRNILEKQKSLHDLAAAIERAIERAKNL